MTTFGKLNLDFFLKKKTWNETLVKKLALTIFKFLLINAVVGLCLGQSQMDLFEKDPEQERN